MHIRSEIEALERSLREVSKKQPAAVSRFVSKRLERLSGVTFREAVKYLEDTDRAALTARFRRKKR